MGKRYRSPLDVAIGAYKRKTLAEEDLDRMNRALSALVSSLTEEDFKRYYEETEKWDRQQSERRKVLVQP